MPLRECYCWDCEEQRASGMRNHRPRPEDEPTRDAIGYDSMDRRIPTRIHEICGHCGHRDISCGCVPCPGCEEQGQRRYHECQGRTGAPCGGFTCDGSCQCAMRTVMGYGAVPPTVNYCKVSDQGNPVAQPFSTLSREMRRRGSGGRYPVAPDRAPYLGLEIETECPNGDVQDIVVAWFESGLGWTTHDSSLRTGAECKTHPSTYRYLVAEGLDGVLGEIVALGGRAWGHESTGLHAHVSRKAFHGRAHEYLFSWLQVSAFRDQCVKLAGRQDAHYAAWPKKREPGQRPIIPPRPGHPMIVANLTPVERSVYDRNLTPNGGYSSSYLLDHFHEQRIRTWRLEHSVIERPSGPQSPLRVIAGKESKGDRSVAINVNPETIELRYWKGTLCASSVLGQCAFIDALIKFSGEVKVSPATRDQVTWERFGEWCLDHLEDGQTQHVAQLCANRGVSFIVPISPGPETHERA